MAHIRFGQFLINRGIVTEDDVYDALHIQQKKTRSIQDIALFRRMLGRHDIETILAAMKDTSMTFIEVAIQQQYLTEQEAQELRKAQRMSRPPLGEILIELEKISRDTLEIELDNFLKLQNI